MLVSKLVVPLVYQTITNKIISMKNKTEINEKLTTEELGFIIFGGILPTLGIMYCLICSHFHI